MEHYQGAEAFVEVLNKYGVDNIFFNPGGEQAAIQANIARKRVLGQKAPRLVLCLDESVAMTAAHGHYVVSGQPQLVMVHSELGTQQVGGALHNAQWGRVPLVLWAGLAGAQQRTNWKKEPYDQGMMVRNCVKWDHQITPDENIQEVLQEAFKIAMSEPRGPVYICYGWDALTKTIDKKPVPRLSPVPLPAAKEDSLSKIADALIAAKNPLIVVGYTGRYPESIPLLVDLAEILAAPVLTSQVCMNFPTTHPLCAGIEQILGSRKGNPYIADADVILVIDYDVAYALAEGLPGKKATIIQIDVDPLTQGRLLWGRGADTIIKADSRKAIPALTKRINQKLTAEKRAQFSKRYKQLEATHKKWRNDWRKQATNSKSDTPISPDWLFRCLAQIIDEDTIVVQHTISHSASPTEQIDRTKPGSLIGCPGGSIQFAPAAAFGAKIAAPEKVVVSIMSDGGFIWGGSEATLWSARAYHAPYLTIICDNQSYGVIKLLVQRSSGETDLTDEMAFEAGVDFVPPLDYAAIGEACGAYGKTVKDPADVLPVLKEALKQVRHGRAAVVDVRLARA